MSTHVGICDLKATALFWEKLLSECTVELLYGKMYILKQKGAVYMSYTKPTILCWCEVWCLKLNKIGILQRTKRSTMKAMCEVQLRDRKRAKAMMLMMSCISCLWQTVCIGRVMS